jgi:hypothetical protein
VNVEIREASAKGAAKEGRKRKGRWHFWRKKALIVSFVGEGDPPEAVAGGAGAGGGNPAQMPEKTGRSDGPMRFNRFDLASQLREAREEQRAFGGSDGPDPPDDSEAGIESKHSPPPRAGSGTCAEAAAGAATRGRALKRRPSLDMTHAERTEKAIRTMQKANARAEARERVLLAEPRRSPSPSPAGEPARLGARKRRGSFRQLTPRI